MTNNDKQSSTKHYNHNQRLSNTNLTNTGSEFMCSEKTSSSYFNSVQYEYDSRMKKSWTITKGQSEALNQRRTDNTMDKNKQTQKDKQRAAKYAIEN